MHSIQYLRCIINSASWGGGSDFPGRGTGRRARRSVGSHTDVRQRSGGEQGRWWGCIPADGARQQPISRGASLDIKVIGLHRTVTNGVSQHDTWQPRLMGGAEVMHTSPHGKGRPMKIVWGRRERERQLRHASTSDGCSKARYCSRPPDVRDPERCQQSWESSTVHGLSKKWRRGERRERKKEESGGEGQREMTQKSSD